MFAMDALRLWPAADKARFALALPFEMATWDWVEGWGEDVAAEYWRMIASYWMTDAVRDAARAIRSFLNLGRPFAALEVMSMCLHRDREALTPDLMLSVLRAVTSAATGEAPVTEIPRAGDGLGYGIGELLTAVEQVSVIDETEIARIEWVWLPLLRDTERGLSTLHRLLARDPAFFTQAIGIIYRPRLPPGEEEARAAPDESSRRRAEMACRLLQEWRGVPGRTDAGALDEESLREWVATAREALRASGHAELGDEQIGEVLARVPVGSDEIWPHECLRTLLEEWASNAIEDGVYLGRVNGRGVTSRLPETGGEPEHALSERYGSWAATVAPLFPRTARVLRRLADSYRSDARREDDSRDLDEFGR